MDRDRRPYSLPGQYTSGGSSGRHGQVSRRYNQSVCRLESCLRPATYPHPYCMADHARQAVRNGQVEGCQQCHEYPRNHPFEFCSRSCGVKAREARDALKDADIDYSGAAPRRPALPARRSAPVIAPPPRKTSPAPQAVPRKPAPEVDNLIDLDDTVMAEPSTTAGDEPNPEPLPVVTARPADLPDPAKRWTFHYHPCGCSATRNLDYPPTFYRCPICGERSSPKHVEHLGIMSQYEPLGGYSTRLTQPTAHSTLTGPLPESMRAIPTLRPTRPGASASNVRPKLDIPFANGKVPARAPSPIEYSNSPTSPFAETESTPRTRTRPASIAVESGSSLTAANGRAPRHPDLKSAFGRRGSEEDDELPPFSRQASSHDATASVRKEVEDDGSAIINPFRDEPFSAVSEDRSSESASMVSLDRLSVRDGGREKAGSDMSSSYELPDHPGGYPTEEFEVRASTPSQDWTLGMEGKGKGTAPRPLRDAAAEKRRLYPNLDDEPPSAKLVVPRQVGPREAPWRARRTSDVDAPETPIIAESLRSPLLRANQGQLPAEDDANELPEHPGAWDTPRPAAQRHHHNTSQEFLGRIILHEEERDTHFKLTNAAKCTVRYEDRTYPTAEHLFHALKFLSVRPNLAEHIRLCGEKPTEEAKKWKFEVRPDWPDITIPTMHEVLQKKFDQHPELKEELLDTGEKELYFVSQDDFWGDGGNGEGRNEFGKALMSIRSSYLMDL